MRNPTTRNLFLLFCLACLPFGHPSAAQAPEQRYDQVNLSAQASQEVDNDTLIAVLNAQEEGSELSRLTDKVNRRITRALKEAKAAEGIKVQTLGYQTSPVYQQQHLSGWRVRQSIRLESRQNERLGDLIGRLQSSLALDAMSYAISDERRREVENQLIKQAIDAFRERARLVASRLGHDRYRLVEMSINTSGRSTPPMRMRANLMSMESRVAAPTLEAGSQTVTVEINGRIELQIQ